MRDLDAQKMVRFAAPKSYMAEHACFTSQLLKYSEMLPVRREKFSDKQHQTYRPAEQTYLDASMGIEELMKRIIELEEKNEILDKKA